MSAPADVAGAYARCEAITREQAANFYYGIRLLSAERRRAMCAVYAFARRVDDIGDGPLPAPEKLRRLDEQAAALALLASPDSGALAGDPVLLALQDAGRRFPLPQEALRELIEGVRMDLAGTRYETLEELLLYCRRVAGTIGRLCLAIFGLREPGAVGAPELADALGVALQLTNILRDVREDAEGGRVYLPGEDLRRFELPAEGGEQGAAALLAALDSHDPEVRARLTELVRFEAARAREWFERGSALAPLLDRRSAACLLAMAGIYRRVLERIDADPHAALARRTSLPVHEKAWVALRGVLGAAA